MARQLGLYVQDINKIHVIRGCILLAATTETTSLVWYDLSNPLCLVTGVLAPPFWHRGGGTGLVVASVEGTFVGTVTVYLSNRSDGTPETTPLTSFGAFDTAVNEPKHITIDRPFRWIAAALTATPTLALSGTVDGVDIYGILP